MEDDTKKAIHKELARLARKNGGRLTPGLVVDTAKDPDSPLHDCFEWDDEKAAEQYRMDQARALIRSVKVVIETSNAKIRTVGYVRDPEAETGEQGYVSTKHIRSQKDLARDAVIAEFNRVKALLARARTLAAALELEEDIDVLIDSVVTLQQQIESYEMPMH